MSLDEFQNYDENSSDEEKVIDRKNPLALAEEKIRMLMDRLFKSEKELNQMEKLLGGQKQKLQDANQWDATNSGSGCSGSNVMGCFTDVYSNHGWGSVAASLTTAFIPQTAVAFALACAAKNGC